MSQQYSSAAKRQTSVDGCSYTYMCICTTDHRCSIVCDQWTWAFETGNRVLLSFPVAHGNYLRVSDGKVEAQNHGEEQSKDGR